MYLKIESAFTGPTPSLLHISTNVTIEDIITSLITLFKMSSAGHYELSWPGLPSDIYYLDKSKTLSDYKIEDHPTLTLHDLGNTV